MFSVAPWLTNPGRGLPQSVQMSVSQQNLQQLKRGEDGESVIVEILANYKYRFLPDNVPTLFSDVSIQFYAQMMPRKWIFVQSWHTLMSGMGPSLLLSHKDIFMKIRTGVYFKIYQVWNNKSHFITESHNKQLYKTCSITEYFSYSKSFHRR